MPGYTKKQLEAKGAKLSNYILCENCELYWHKRAFKKHLNSPASAPPEGARQVAIIHPAHQAFLEWVARAIVKKVKERLERARRGEKVDEPEPATSTAPLEIPTAPPEVITVDEAVARFGLSREEILAEFEKNLEPFEVALTPASTPRPPIGTKMKRAPARGERGSGSR